MNCPLNFVVMALNLYLIEKLVHFGRANGKEQVERKQPVHRVGK